MQPRECSVIFATTTAPLLKPANVPLLPMDYARLQLLEKECPGLKRLFYGYWYL
jgi:hypothetical protein